MYAALLLVFGVILGLAVLVSERAKRTILSTSVVFLLAGFLVGEGWLEWVEVTTGDGIVEAFAELALFSILFVDGARLPVRNIAEAWRLPGRALLVGLPLTIGGVALAGHLLLGLSWVEALLLGAILSPTDPVLVAVILEREEVPLRLRRLLSVESGLNDGLALPIVTVLLAVAGREEVHALHALSNAGLGIAVGVALPWLYLKIEGRSFFRASEAYRPLAGAAIACMLLGLARLGGFNEFLAAFAGGVTLASVRPGFSAEMRRVGEPLAEVLKLATLLLFGAMLSVGFLLATGWAGLAFAVVALVAVRPLALVLAFSGSALDRREWLAAGWFGPRGFASLLYALLMLHAGLGRGDLLFQAAALVITLSILAHSSTDVAVARVFREADERSRGQR